MSSATFCVGWTSRDSRAAVEQYLGLPITLWSPLVHPKWVLWWKQDHHLNGHEDPKCSPLSKATHPCQQHQKVDGCVLGFKHQAARFSWLSLSKLEIKCNRSRSVGCRRKSQCPCWICLRVFLQATCSLSTDHALRAGAHSVHSWSTPAFPSSVRIQFASSESVPLYKQIELGIQVQSTRLIPATCAHRAAALHHPLLETLPSRWGTQWHITLTFIALTGNFH